MSTIFVNLTEAQRRAHKKAKESNQPWTVKLSKKQILLSSSEHTELTPDHLPLNKTQAKQHLAAVMAKRGLELKFSAKNVKRGGFFFAILPALAAMAPGLLGAAPQILDGVKQGYETVGKLAGIKTGSAISEKDIMDSLDSILAPSNAGSKNSGSKNSGSSLVMHGQGADNIQVDTGASLRMFGEGSKPKRTRTKKSKND